jgi:hypothetical protein
VEKSCYDFSLKKSHSPRRKAFHLVQKDETTKPKFSKNKKAIRQGEKLFIGLTTKPAMGYKAIA